MSLLDRGTFLFTGTSPAATSHGIDFIQPRFCDTFGLNDVLSLALPLLFCVCACVYVIHMVCTLRQVLNIGSQGCHGAALIVFANVQQQQCFIYCGMPGCAPCRYYYSSDGLPCSLYREGKERFLCS